MGKWESGREKRKMGRKAEMGWLPWILGAGLVACLPDAMMA